MDEPKRYWTSVGSGADAHLEECYLASDYDALRAEFAKITGPGGPERFHELLEAEAERDRAMEDSLLMQGCNEVVIRDRAEDQKIIAALRSRLAVLTVAADFLQKAATEVAHYPAAMTALTGKDRSAFRDALLTMRSALGDVGDVRERLAECLHRLACPLDGSNRDFAVNEVIAAMLPKEVR